MISVLEIFQTHPDSLNLHLNLPQEPDGTLLFIEGTVWLDPNDNEIAHLCATMLLKAARYREAEAALRAALARDAENTDCRLALAQSLLQQRQPQAAITHLRAVQQGDPSRVEAAYELGVLAAKQGDLAEAARQLERAVAADAGYSNVLWHLGRTYLRQGRTAEGRKLLAAFRQMDASTSAYETALARLAARPHDPDVHARLARLHLLADELPQAIVELRRVLELRPGDPTARRDLAAALKRQGRLTEAHRLTAAASQAGRGQG